MGLIIVFSLLGIVLIIAEIVLIPGIFLTGLLGLGCTAGACYYAFTTFGATTGWIVCLANIVLCSLALFLAMRSKTWNKIALNTTLDSPVKTNDVEMEELQPGLTGTTISRLNPMGKVRFLQEIYEATSQEGWIDANETVEIIRIEDHHIWVKKL